MFLPKDIADLILEFLPDYDLLKWIDAKKLSWSYLSANPNAINLLEQNKDQIVWNRLSENPAAIYLLKQNKDKINWDRLSENPAAITLLRKKKKKN